MWSFGTSQEEISYQVATKGSSGNRTVCFSFFFGCQSKTHVLTVSAQGALVRVDEEDVKPEDYCHYAPYFLL